MKQEAAHHGFGFETDAAGGEQVGDAIGEGVVVGHARVLVKNAKRRVGRRRASFSFTGGACR
jgi:hypothetical protein